MGMKQKKKNCFFEKKNQNGRLKKNEISETANSQYCLELGLTNKKNMSNIQIGSSVLGLEN